MTEDSKVLACKYFKSAYEHQMRGELDQAELCYKQSIEQHPTAEAHTYLGWTYSFMGLYEQAIAECQQAIRLDPDFGNPYNDIGAYLIEQDKLDDAIPWLERATQAQRYECVCFPYYNLGRIWEKKGDWAQALALYETSLMKNPDYTLASRAISRLRACMN